MYRRLVIIALTFAITGLAACAGGNWTYKPLAEFAPASSPHSATVCEGCHKDAVASWNTSTHADAEAMKNVSVEAFKQCGACHNVSPAHSDAPSANKPQHIASMSKTEQNEVCGKCHYNIEVSEDAINPDGRHGVFMDVGFSPERKRQIACLDCHTGHGEGNQLKHYQAHICFSCHKEAIVTMGIFQPFNYLAAGKFCQACHSVHGSTPGRQAGHMAAGFLVCVPCHV